MQSPDNADNPISTVTANAHADAKKSPEEICRTLRENTMTTPSGKKRPKMLSANSVLVSVHEPLA